MHLPYRALLAAFCFAAVLLQLDSVMAQTQPVEKKIWSLLDNSKAAFVSLGEADFRAGGAGFDLPDGGRSVSALAAKAPGGAFDPRDVANIPAQELGYKADWVVERFRRYNLDWDITGLRLTSLNPEAKNHPWFIIINGGAANFYEFFVDLKNNPGWAQYLAQKLNVMIVTIPGNFIPGFNCSGLLTPSAKLNASNCSRGSRPGFASSAIISVKVGRPTASVT
jgi:hypothetical protein